MMDYRHYIDGNASKSEMLRTYIEVIMHYQCVIASGIAIAFFYIIEIEIEVTIIDSFCK